LNAFSCTFAGRFAAAEPYQPELPETPKSSQSHPVGALGLARVACQRAEGVRDEGLMLRAVPAAGSPQVHGGVGAYEQVRENDQAC